MSSFNKLIKSVKNKVFVSSSSSVLHKATLLPIESTGTTKLDFSSLACVDCTRAHASDELLCKSYLAPPASSPPLTKEEGIASPASCVSAVVQAIEEKRVWEIKDSEFTSRRSSFSSVASSVLDLPSLLNASLTTLGSGKSVFFEGLDEHEDFEEVHEVEAHPVKELSDKLHEDLSLVLAGLREVPSQFDALLVDGILQINGDEEEDSYGEEVASFGLFYTGISAPVDAKPAITPRPIAVVSPRPLSSASSTFEFDAPSVSPSSSSSSFSLSSSDASSVGPATPRNDVDPTMKVISWEEMRTEVAAKVGRELAYF